VRDASIYERASRDPEGFWAEQAARLSWRRPWERVLEWEAPWAKWFSGGYLNACENCVDRHLLTWRRNKAALIWEGEPGDGRVLTFRGLHREVCRAASVLRRLGVGAGDRVAIYMPVIPEQAIAALACARIGAVHVMVHSRYSPEALRDRILDAGARILITADGGYYRGNVLPLKDQADAAVAECPEVRHVLTVRRVGEQALPVRMDPGRDLWWHETVETARWEECPPEPVESEHPLAIMYASGAAGKPKGLLHTTGGYLVGNASATGWIFDLKEEDVLFSTADLSWSVGQSCGLYGPLANGTTVLLYEGSWDAPARDRLWQLVSQHGVTVLLTSPSTIRAAMRSDPEPAQHHMLSSLRVLATAGEPIGDAEWTWYYQRVGGERCPVVDMWWQTETGMPMIAPLPGLTPLKPGSATLPLPGVRAEVVDDQGFTVEPEVPGHLVITAPWPAMARTVWGDPQRYYRQYWGRFQGVYLTGDGAQRDRDGYFWLMGRVDNVLNVGGQRISTLEIENVLTEHAAVREAAVVGVRHPVKGQAIAAYVALEPDHLASDAMTVELKAYLVERIGDVARPDRIEYVAELPRAPGTNQVLRRLLRAIAEGEVAGGTAALLDPTVRAHYVEPLG
jgi:acetyl-CoA synthetase